MSSRNIFLTTLFVVTPAFIFLLVLGFWQLQRMQWKTDLIEIRKENYANEVVTLSSALSSIETHSWKKVFVNGRYDHNKEIFLWSIREGMPGWQVLTPLIPKERTDLRLLIDRGWIPKELKDSSLRAEGQINDQVTVSGYIRNDLDYQGPFTPVNDIHDNTWYFVDYPEIESLYNIELVRSVLIADSTPNPGGWPLGDSELPKLNNNHLNYAITWFCLALAAIFIWILVVRRSYKDGKATL